MGSGVTQSKRDATSALHVAHKVARPRFKGRMRLPAAATLKEVAHLAGVAVETVYRRFPRPGAIHRGRQNDDTRVVVKTKGKFPSALGLENRRIMRVDGRRRSHIGQLA